MLEGTFDDEYCKTEEIEVFLKEISNKKTHEILFYKLKDERISLELKELFDLTNSLLKELIFSETRFQTGRYDYRERIAKKCGNSLSEEERKTMTELFSRKLNKQRRENLEESLVGEIRYSNIQINKNVIPSFVHFYVNSIFKIQKRVGSINNLYL